MSHDVGGGSGKSYRPTIDGVDLRAYRMLGSYWMFLTHKEAERVAGGDVAKTGKAMDQIPDLSICGKKTLSAVKYWEREKVAEWRADGRINRHGILTPSDKRPDKTALALYNIFKVTGGTRRKEGISRTQARSLRKFLYGNEEPTWPTADQTKSGSTAERAEAYLPPTSDDQCSDHGRTSASGVVISKRSPKPLHGAGNDPQTETHSTQSPVGSASIIGTHIQNSPNLEEKK